MVHGQFFLKGGRHFSFLFNFYIFIFIFIYLFTFLQLLQFFTTFSFLFSKFPISYQRVLSSFQNCMMRLKKNCFCLLASIIS